MSGVGTRKVYEDDHLIVWHLDLAPGEHGAKHTHKLDYLFKVISGSTLEVYGARDELLDTVVLEPGGAHSFLQTNDSSSFNALDFGFDNTDGVGSFAC